MGWGWIPTSRTQNINAPHVDNPPDNFSAQDFWRWVQEATSWNILSGDSNPLASSRALVDRSRWQSAGLPHYFDMDAGLVEARLSFSVKLQRPGPEQVPITTYSAAETFFARPHARADGASELPNLFHPFWQARLAPEGTGESERGMP